MDKLELARQSAGQWQHSIEIFNDSIIHKQVEIENTFNRSIAVLSGLEQVVATFAALYVAGAIFSMTRLRELEKKSQGQSTVLTRRIWGLPNASLLVMSLTLIAILTDSITIYLMPSTGLTCFCFAFIVFVNLLPVFTACTSFYLHLKS